MYMVDEDGNRVASYSYDPYGAITSISGSMSQINPIRYRGYYYDTETGFYYLQSRYYDPSIGRFINADAFASTGQGFLGYNMFVYCNNNPIMYSDSLGKAAMFSCTVNVCDGGSGYTNVDITQEIFGERESRRRRSEEAIESGDVFYEVHNDGTVKIHNSYKVRSIPVMIDFISENRGDEIKGSTTGVVFEWVLHNAAYDCGKTDQAADLDVGSTIYADRHGIFTVLMIMGYWACSPSFARYDFYMEYINYD